MNPRPSAWEADALPLSYFRKNLFLYYNNYKAPHMICQRFWLSIIENPPAKLINSLILSYPLFMHFRFNIKHPIGTVCLVICSLFYFESHFYNVTKFRKSPLGLYTIILIEILTIFLIGSVITSGLCYNLPSKLLFNIIKGWGFDKDK